MWRGGDGARHLLSSQPVTCSSWLYPSVRAGLGSGWARSWGRPGEGVGTPGGSPGPWLYALCAPGLHRLDGPEDRWCTEGDRGLAGMAAGVSARALSAPTAPQALRSAVPGCVGRHALGGRGRGRNIPPVCRPAQAGADSAGPRPPPSSPPAILPGEGPALAQVEARRGGWGQARLGAPVAFPSTRRRVPGGTGPRAPVHGLGHTQPPASSLRTDCISREQRWLLGSEKATRPPVARPGGPGVVARRPDPEDCAAVAAALPPDLEPSPAQLTRPAVW